MFFRPKIFVSKSFQAEYFRLKSCFAKTWLMILSVSNAGKSSWKKGSGLKLICLIVLECQFAIQLWKMRASCYKKLVLLLYNLLQQIQGFHVFWELRSNRSKCLKEETVIKERWWNDSAGVFLSFQKPTFFCSAWLKLNPNLGLNHPTTTTTTTNFSATSRHARKLKFGTDTH